jgi:hypothetical protein
MSLPPRYTAVTSHFLCSFSLSSSAFGLLPLSAPARVLCVTRCSRSAEVRPPRTVTSPQLTCTRSLSAVSAEMPAVKPHVVLLTRRSRPMFHATVSRVYTRAALLSPTAPSPSHQPVMCNACRVTRAWSSRSVLGPAFFSPCVNLRHDAAVARPHFNGADALATSSSTSTARALHFFVRVSGGRRPVA